MNTQISTNTLRIAIDISGGDNGSQSIYPAVVQAAQRHPHVEFYVYGDASVEADIQLLLSADSPQNVIFNRSGTPVEMSDSPASALRHKRNSSMALALKAVAEKRVDGCISAGNTGALVAMGIHFLSCYEGLKRPALCKAIPVVNRTNRHQQSLNHSYLLDLGANVNCSSAQLAQFASLGATLCSIIDKRSAPSVRLLNIGRESIKGSSVVQRAAAILEEQSGLNYCGFIEADEIFQGIADVIVCDGFSGNVALKASEGMARLVTHNVKQSTQSGVVSRLLSWFASPLIQRWKENMNPDRYNGAYLLGLKGTVVKSHGAADQQQFFYALTMLIEQITQNKNLDSSQPVNDMEACFQRACG